VTTKRTGTTKTKPAKKGGPKTTGRLTRAKTKATGAPAKRLRPGELDGLVTAYLRKRRRTLPLGPGVVARGIGRSSGAVANCLERLTEAEKSPVRRAREKPRAYDLGPGSQKA
jgi:hypothetical protein